MRLTLPLQPFGPAGAFVLTDEQVAAISPGPKVFPVKVTVNGHTFALRLSRMAGQNCIGLRREVRDAAGLTLGETVEVEISADAAPRTVEVPADLAAALAENPSAAQAFDALAYSHRKEFARWVGEAKREQTRAERVATTVEMVLAGRTR